MSNDRPAIVVSAPAHAIVADMLVRLGDRVTKGQTLMVLDEDKLTFQLMQVQDLVLATQFELSCALDTAGIRLPDLRDLSIATATQLRLADKRCRAAHHGANTEIAQQQVRLDQIEGQMQTLQAQIAIFQAAAMSAQTDETQLEKMLKTQIVLQHLTSKAAQAQIVLQTLIANRDAADLKQAQDLVETLTTQQTKHETLEQMLATPRILAPNAGTIVRLRDVTGQALFQETAVLDIATDTGGNFQVTLDVPEH
ncbi:MAG: biotin/lipoyl-binding protein, partial [Planktomarina sp.]